MARLHAFPRRRTSGQAMVEALVVAIALVPLAVLVVLLGKYQSIQSSTIAASRSFAFDCAARPQVCTDATASAWLLESLRLRHFARPDRAILSGDRVAEAAPVAAGGSPSEAGPSGVDRHPLWRDRAGRPLLERLNDVGGAVSTQRFDAGLGTAVGRGAGAGAAEVLDRLAGPARFGLAIEQGLFDARVQVEVAPSHSANAGFARLDPLAVTMRARTAILTDAWQASGPRGGPASVASRLESGARLDALRETRLTIGYQLTRWAIDLMGAIGLEPAARSFRYHEVDPDAVPADRVGQP